MISVILIEPENPGNIGAVARAMKNFDLSKLILVNPRCSLDETAVARAKHGKDILKMAKVRDFSFLDRFDTLVGTTAKIGTDYNIPRCPITPEDLGKKLSKSSAKTGILLGREGMGLTNEEIRLCDLVVTIPASLKYPTLNISHAAQIIFYEIFKHSGKKKSNEHIESATATDKRILENNISRVLDTLQFTTADKKETQKRVWKRIIGKSFLTKREAFALIGFFKKLNK
ncbi:MAG: RNA methyltransferase [archaeon]